MIQIKYGNFILRAFYHAISNTVIVIRLLPERCKQQCGNGVSRCNTSYSESVVLVVITDDLLN